MLIDTKEYPTQLHLDYFGLFGKQKFYYNLNTRILVKPTRALWTSSLYPKGKKVLSDWMEWCEDEGYLYGEPDYIHLKALPDSKIFQIDGYNDLAYLFEKYGLFYDHELQKKRITKSLTLPNMVELDFHSIAVDYDILWLTKKGQIETHLSMPYNLYGWDCESSVWLRDKFEVIA